MKGTFSWKWAVLALSVAALVATGCAKKQTVKSDGTQGDTGAASAPSVGETPVKEAPPAAPPSDQLASSAQAGVAVTEEKPSQFDDVRFDYDKSEVKEDGRKSCQVVADFLKKNPGAKILIEGHCDERGTEQYNLALGDRRANSAKDFLATLGVDASRIRTVSYGEERPFEEGQSDSALAQNRRAHLVLVR